MSIDSNEITADEIRQFHGLMEAAARRSELKGFVALIDILRADDSPYYIGERAPDFQMRKPTRVSSREIARWLQERLNGD